MSYEGRIQVWCEKGHYKATPALYDSSNPCPEICSCGAPIVFTNEVHDANCDAHGYIEPVEATPPIVCKCSCCGNAHVSVPATYKIPNEKIPRTYVERDDAGKGTRMIIQENA